MIELDVANKPQNIYNIDEKGVRMCLHKSPTVLAQKGIRRVHNRGKIHGESVTIVGCGNALGNAVPPMVLFKGKRRNEDLIHSLPPGSIFEMCEKGSMTSVLFSKWLKHFAEYKSPGKCLLILDGAKCHINISVCKTAEDLGISLFFLPSNTTHELQPMDKCVFRPFETYWDEELSNYWFRHPERELSKYTFGLVLTPTFERSFTRNNIIAGFKACGIFPFNPNVIEPTAFAPSEVTAQLPSTESNEENNCPNEENNCPIDQPALVPIPGTSQSTQAPPSRPSDENIDNPSSTSAVPELNSSELGNRLSSSSVEFSEILHTPKMKTKKRAGYKSLNSRALLLTSEVFQSTDDAPKQKAVKKRVPVPKKPKKRNLQPDKNEENEKRLLPKRKSKAQQKPIPEIDNWSDLDSESDDSSDNYDPKRSKKEPVAPKRTFLKKLNENLQTTWYCYVCKEDSQRDMRRCAVCLEYVHEDCVGLTPDDTDPFVCPECD